MTPAIASALITLLLIYYLVRVRKPPLYKEKILKPDDLTAWRNRLDLTQTTAAELLGVHRVTLANWESGKHPIDKTVQLACIACEFAHKAADQYIKDNPKAFVNGAYRGYSIHHARKQIVNDILNKFIKDNDLPLLITLGPQSIIESVEQSASSRLRPKL